MGTIEGGRIAPSLPHLSSWRIIPHSFFFVTLSLPLLNPILYLMASNLLSHIAHRHLTPSIGTLFPSSFQLSSLLPSSPSSTPSSTSKSTLTALSHLTSARGVVFFRSQDITPPQLTSFASLLGTHSTPLRPSTSTLHRHPISEDTPEITVISSADSGVSRAGLDLRNRASTGWHSDISFEHVPADYSILKMHTLPVSGGDTLFASGYEAYERLSPTYRRFLEGLKAVHAAPFFVQMAKEKGIKIQDGRGSPGNTGDDLIAIQYVFLLFFPLFTRLLTCVQSRNPNTPNYKTKSTLCQQIIHSVHCGVTSGRI